MGKAVEPVDRDSILNKMIFLGHDFKERGGLIGRGRGIYTTTPYRYLWISVRGCCILLTIKELAIRGGVERSHGFTLQAFRVSRSVMLVPKSIYPKLKKRLKM